jgi:hypothetical protein
VTWSLFNAAIGINSLDGNTPLLFPGVSQATNHLMTILYTFLRSTVRKAWEFVLYNPILLLFMNICAYGEWSPWKNLRITLLSSPLSILNPLQTYPILLKTCLFPWLKGKLTTTHREVARGWMEGCLTR